MKNSPENSPNKPQGKEATRLQNVLGVVTLVGFVAAVGYGGPKAIENVRNIGADQESEPVVKEYVKSTETTLDTSPVITDQELERLENEDSFTDPGNG